MVSGMTVRPVLYSFRRCPYAMRARLALASAGVQCTHREILLRDKPSAMLDASPKGTVPVCILPDGRVLEESLDLAFWALKQSDPEGWLAPWSAAPDRANQLVARNDGPFKHHLDRYKYTTRYEDSDATEHRDEGLKILEELDRDLTPTGYLAGEYFTFLDAAIVPFVRQFRIADEEWFDGLPLSALQTWLQKFIMSDRFAITMKKYPVWDGKADRHRFPDL